MASSRLLEVGTRQFRTDFPQSSTQLGVEIDRILAVLERSIVTPGSAREFGGEFCENFRRIARAMVAEDHDAIREAAIAIGYLSGTEPAARQDAVAAVIAMAGERLRIPGFVEISAVCTHPDTRGEGLAGAITLDVVRSIRENGSEAFLHVLDDNENAIRLYQKLGFVVRRKVDVVFARWHGPGWEPDPVNESPTTAQRPNFDLGST